MSSNPLCRLCISAYTESKSLFDEFGQGNDVYEITVKYFDPMVCSRCIIYRGVCVVDQADFFSVS